MERRTKTRKLVGKYIIMDCDCGQHIIDLFSLEWDTFKTGSYTCPDCFRPLVCKGDDGRFYFVGKEIT